MANSRGEKTSGASDPCVGCKVPTGDAPKRAPVHVNDDAGGHELWCPCCFVGTRAPMEPRRFAPWLYAAVRCSLCGWDSVDFGQRRCAQCGSRFITVLPPTRGLVRAAPLLK
ncbi:MAG TPA: hypothetical protein VGG39_37725 [Polyangiaceae bacterium]